VRDLPRLSGCSREGMAMIAGHLARIGLALVAPDPGAARGKVVRLNARGVSARERGIARIARIEAELRARLGRQAGDRLWRALEAVVASPAFAEGIEPPPTGWRDRPPYAAQTGRLLSDARAALPRHPLMLHRGGYPDGA
jgi:hypothetical protein